MGGVTGYCSGSEEGEGMESVDRGLLSQHSLDLDQGRRGGGEGCCREILELKKRVKTLTVDKKVLKEIIREMIYESVTIFWFPIKIL